MKTHANVNVVSGRSYENFSTQKFPELWHYYYAYYNLKADIKATVIIIQ